MCLILFAHKAHPEYPLILAANRDEDYSRPAAAAAFWSDQPKIYGGRDLEKGGTWLGVTLGGKVAAVTNFRDGRARGTAPRSRGELVSNYLASGDDAGLYLERVKSEGDQYKGFILIAGDLENLYWLSNRGPGVEKIPLGVHGLSNHLLNTPWPKIKRAKQTMSALLGAGETEIVATLFALLADRSVAADDELPDTGVGLERERELSSVFIGNERYGTRASTVVLFDNNGGVLFSERSFGGSGKFMGEVARRFSLQKPQPRYREDSSRGASRGNSM